MRKDSLNSVASAVKKLKKYIKENENNIDKSKKIILRQALKAARSIISSNRTYFNSQELRELFNDND